MPKAGLITPARAVDGFLHPMMVGQSSHRMETMVKHKQELIDILMADAKLRVCYADKDGNTCAIGGIAAAFGWEPKPLRVTNRGQNNGTGVRDLLSVGSFRMMPPLKRAIKHFALTVEQVVAIQTKKRPLP